MILYPQYSVGQAFNCADYVQESGEPIVFSSGLEDFIQMIFKAIKALFSKINPDPDKLERLQSDPGLRSSPMRKQRQRSKSVGDTPTDQSPFKSPIEKKDEYHIPGQFELVFDDTDQSPFKSRIENKDEYDIPGELELVFDDPLYNLRSNFNETILTPEGRNKAQQKVIPKLKKALKKAGLTFYDWEFKMNEEVDYDNDFESGSKKYFSHTATIVKSKKELTTIGISTGFNQLMDDAIVFQNQYGNKAKFTANIQPLYVDITMKAGKNPEITTSFFYDTI